MNTPRNRSTNFKDHKGLMVSKAKLYYGRVLKAQLTSVNFDDVFGELSIAFVQAVEGYDPDKGFTFTAFLGRCMQTHINKFIAKLMKEQFGVEQPDEFEHVAMTGGLGYVSVDDIAGADGESVGYDLFQCGTFCNPEESVATRQDYNALLCDPTLLPETRAFIMLLVDPSPPQVERIKARIKAKSGLVRAQIERRWNVKLDQVNLHYA